MTSLETSSRIAAPSQALRGVHPVLILAFNRPESARRLIEAVISLYNPPRIYLAVDGPRGHRAGETTKVQQVRGLAKTLPDDIEVRTRFSDVNQGCFRGVSAAITWFFSHEEAGIILEDDIVPTRDFFSFCDHCLKRFADDKRIMHVTGSLYLPTEPEHRAQWYRTTYPHVWGWATWRRAWQHFDPELISQPRHKIVQWLKHVSGNGRVRLFYRLALEMTRQGKLDSWAFRWFLSVAAARGYAVAPGCNLVLNSGIGVESTHTRFEHHLSGSKTGSVEVQQLEPEPVAASEVSDSFHLFFNQATSWRKLLRMQASVLIPNSVFRKARALRG